MAEAPLIGRSLSHYRITAALGAGGMGEVYCATDGRLGRDVAIKVLPPEVAQAPERLARFEREAKLLASLNHTNIAHVYGFESATLPDGKAVHFLAMELVEGEDLAERLKRGRIPLEDALPIALQIAEALEEAHEHGIVHRDLKPANIKLTPGGKVKVLDFGLAKAYADGDAHGSSAPDLSQSPTLAHTGTQAGLILGTAAYMSPEQARGKPVDKRADIWAFGVVLWEMLTGRRLFDGGSVSDVLAAVLREEPDLELVPKPARRLLEACLARDPGRRLRDIGDARLLLDAGSARPDPSEGPPPREGRWLWPGLTLLCLAAAAVLAALLLQRSNGPQKAPVIFDVNPSGRASNLALSPDGRRLVYEVSTGAGELREIWIRSFDETEPRRLSVSESQAALHPLWSTDGQAVFSFDRGRLVRLDLAGGNPQAVLDLPCAPTGGTWADHGASLLFGCLGFSGEAGVYLIPREGGAAARLTQGASGRLDFSHVVRSLLPDGRHFVYLRVPLGGERRGRSYEVFLGATDLPPEEQPGKPMFRSDVAPVYLAQDDPGDRVPGDGYLLFSRDGALWTRPFDSSRLALVGDEAPLGVGSSSGEVRELDASAGGTLATTAGTAVPSQLLLLDRKGNVVDEIGPPGRYGELGLSADGRYLAVSRLDAGEVPHVWIVDPERKVFSRLNPGDSTDYAPFPSTDGRVAFTDDQGRIWARAANGVGEARLLLSGPTTRHANDWSRDGRYLIYDDHVPGNAQDLFVLPLEDDAKPIPILETTADEVYGKLSPDGRWIAYTSNESGRYEVYVRDFRPDRNPAYGSERLQVSMNGGDKPSWSSDGREIFFITPDESICSVRIETSPTVRASAPQRLFRRRTRGYYPLAVTPKGQFVLNALPETAARPDPITVVLNWQSLLLAASQ